MKEVRGVLLVRSIGCQGKKMVLAGSLELRTGTVADDQKK